MTTERPEWTNATDSLYPYLFWEELVALQAARDADVTDRLMDPEHETVIDVFNAVEEDAHFFVRAGVDGSNIIETTAKGRRTDISGTLKNIARMETRVPGRKTMTSEAVRCTVAASLDPDYLIREFPHQELRGVIIAIGLLAAQHKPRQDRLPIILRPDYEPPVDEPIGDDDVFIPSMRLLQGLHARAFSWPGEEAAIGRKHQRFVDRLLVEKSDQTLDTLNRYDFGRLTRRMIEFAMDPSTTRQNVRDEIDVWLGKVKRPVIPPPLPEYSGPILRLPWPILGSPKPPSRPHQKPVGEPIPRGEGLGTIKDEWRTRWLGLLAMSWPYDSYLVEVDFRSASVKDNEYEAALLVGPDGQIFAGVAETDIAWPSNSLHVAIEADLRDHLGRPISVLDVFGGLKREACDMGSKQFNHGGLDFHRRIMDFLRKKFKAQFDYLPDLSRMKKGVKRLPSQRRAVQPAEIPATARTADSLAKIAVPARITSGTGSGFRLVTDIPPTPFTPSETPGPPN